MAFGIIYKITCIPNGKVYIGQTIRTLESRFKRHINEALKTDNPRIKFQRAIKKYGEENFTVEKIDEAFSKEELDEKEKYWISKYDSINTGYNTATGGEGGNTYKGIDKESLISIKQKIAEKNKGRHNGMSNQIKAFSVKRNKEYTFDTLTDCLNFLGIKNKLTVMSRVNGNDNTLWRHEWKFAFEDKDYIEFIDAPDYDASCRHGTKVILTKDGKEQIFNSKNKAGIFLGVNGKALINNSIVNGYLIQFS